MKNTYVWLCVSGKLKIEQWRLVFDFFGTPNVDRIINDLKVEKNIDPDQPLFDQLTEDEADTFLCRANTSSCDYDGTMFSNSLISLTNEEFKFEPEMLNSLRDSFDFDFFHEAYNNLDALHYINRMSCNPPLYAVTTRKEYEDQAYAISSTQVIEKINSLETIEDVQSYIKSLQAANHRTFNSLLQVD